MPKFKLTKDLEVKKYDINIDGIITIPAGTEIEVEEVGELKNGTLFWYIDDDGEVKQRKWDDAHNENSSYLAYSRKLRDFLGIYKSESEAEAAAEKIREFVKSLKK